jgi:HipA-like protein
MAAVFPVHFPDQLHQRLRALRKRQGLNQAQLGALIDFRQARIADIEANPELVSFEQLMRLRSVMGVSLTLNEKEAAPAITRAPAAKAARPEATEPSHKNAFSYDPCWLESRRRRSLSLPVLIGGTPEIQGQRARNYFDKLLPDNERIRSRLRRRFGLWSGENFELLEAIVRECVGAVQLLPEGVTPEGWIGSTATR